MRSFTPKTRAEALGGTLADIRQAASEDRAFLHGLAVILADLIAPPAAKPAAPEPTGDRGAWQQANRAILERRAHG